MSKTFYVETEPEEATAILCEHPECETYYQGEAATQHLERNPDHTRFEWLKLEVA